MQSEESGLPRDRHMNTLRHEWHAYQPATAALDNQPFTTAEVERIGIADQSHEAMLKHYQASPEEQAASGSHAPLINWNWLKPPITPW